MRLRPCVGRGGKSWYFVSSEDAFGISLEEDAGKVIGHVCHPINTSDFSSFLRQAQASKAQVVGLASSGSDTLNAIKGAREFGLRPSMMSEVKMPAGSTKPWDCTKRAAARPLT